MANNKPPKQRITGIRAPIPSGYILGRVSAGYGDVELISAAKAQSVGIIPVTLPPSGAAGGDLSGTYPNPTVAKINTQALPAPATVAFSVLMYSGSNLAWTNQHLNGGNTGQVATKNSNTDFDISWNTPHYLIAGGTTGQVLTKNSNADYDVVWTTPSAGGSGSSASSFFLDGTHGYIAEVDSNGLLVLDSMGRGIYSVDPVLPVAMIPTGAYPIALTFQAKLTSNQTLTSGNFSQCIPDTFVTNTMGTQYSTSTGKFTPTKAGIYAVFATGQSQTSGAITQNIVSLFKNGGSGVGTQICTGQSPPNSASSLFSYAANCFGVVSMNGSTDWVEMGVRADTTGGTLVESGAGNVTFGAIYIGQ